MSNSVSTSTDKIIVDRTRAHRSKPVSKAVRATRERLQFTAQGAHAFDREMLSQHVHTVLQSALITPVVIILVAIVGMCVRGRVMLVGGFAVDKLVGVAHRHQHRRDRQAEYQ